MITTTLFAAKSHIARATTEKVFARCLRKLTLAPMDDAKRQKILRMSETHKPTHCMSETAFCDALIRLGELQTENNTLRARIALLESALGLPEGCDVFDLSRSETEGAVDATGNVWKWFSEHTLTGRVRFFSGDKTMVVGKDGKSLYSDGQLYCIKKGSA